MNATRQMIGAVILSMVVAASVAVGDPTGITSLPFSEDFTGAWQGVWATNNASFVATPTSLIGGFLALSEANDTQPTLSITNTVHSKNVWWRGFAKVSPHSEGGVPDQADVEGSAAAFFVAAEGANMKLFAFSGGAEEADVVDLDYAFAVSPTNTWIGYAVRLDFVNKRWDLYISTSQDVNGTMTKANTNGPLVFVDNTRASFDSVTIKYETSIGAVTAFQAGGSVSAASPATITPQTVDKTTDKWVASRVADKNYTGQNQLNQELGAALAAGLIPGDKIRIHDADGWQAFVLNADGVWAVTDPQLGNKTPDQVSLNPGDSIWFEYAETITGVFTFLDPAWVPEELDKPVSSPSETITLNANNTGSGGWTSVHWGRSQRNISQTSFTPALADRTVVFIINTDTGQVVRGFWNATSQAWETVGGQPLILRPNNKVWFYRPLGDDIPLVWNL